MGFVKDDDILLSLVNTCLRDGGDIDDFCAEHGGTKAELFARLARAGYNFNEDQNAFLRV